MDCAKEIAVVKSVLGRLVGDPERFTFDLLNGVNSVPAGVPATAVIAAVAGTGMTATPVVHEATWADQAAMVA